MPQVTARQKLTKLYPTLEALENARKKYRSWAQMARALGMHTQSLADYRKVVGVEKCKKLGRLKDILTITNDEIDQGIRKLVGDNTANVVTKYKITDPEQFYENPCRNEGLELVGVERGQAFNQAWKDWHIDG